jgi:hypothetical protein
VVKKQNILIRDIHVEEKFIYFMDLKKWMNSYYSVSRSKVFKILKGNKV